MKPMDVVLVIAIILIIIMLFFLLKEDKKPTLDYIEQFRKCFKSENIYIDETDEGGYVIFLTQRETYDLRTEFFTVTTELVVVKSEGLLGVVGVGHNENLKHHQLKQIRVDHFLAGEDVEDLLIEQLRKAPDNNNCRCKCRDAKDELLIPISR